MHAPLLVVLDLSLMVRTATHSTPFGICHSYSATTISLPPYDPCYAIRSSRQRNTVASATGALAAYDDTVVHHEHDTINYLVVLICLPHV